MLNKRGYEVNLEVDFVTDFESLKFTGRRYVDCRCRPGEYSGLHLFFTVNLKHRQNVAGWIFEPCDLWPTVPVNAFLVRLYLAIVTFEADAVFS